MLLQAKILRSRGGATCSEQAACRAPGRVGRWGPQRIMGASASRVEEDRVARSLPGDVLSRAEAAYNTFAPSTSASFGFQDWHELRSGAYLPLDVGRRRGGGRAAAESKDESIARRRRQRRRDASSPPHRTASGEEQERERGGRRLALVTDGTTEFGVLIRCMRLARAHVPRRRRVRSHRIHPDDAADESQGRGPSGGCGCDPPNR